MIFSHKTAYTGRDPAASVSERVAKIKEERDAQIQKIFEGESDKFLVIIGPCSADNADAVCEYIGRLAKVQDKVGDRLLLIPRIYTNKPKNHQEKATKDCCISQIRKRNRTCWLD